MHRARAHGRWGGLQALLALLDRLRASLWLVPSLLTALAIVLAVVGHALDAAVADSDFARFFGDGDGSSHAVDLFGAVAQAAFGIAGVSFSVVMVALVLASNQFNPRLLRNFLRDRADQVVLGVFTATFVYGLVALSLVSPDAPPSISVALVFAYALASVIAFIYFIHHLTHAIQVSSIIERALTETLTVIDRLFAPPHAEAPRRAWFSGVTLRPTPVSGPPAADRAVVRADADGYVMRVDLAALVAHASAHDARLELFLGPGDYATRGQVLATIRAPPGTAGLEPLRAGVRAAVVLGRRRDTQGDPANGVRQLVDLALKAISPGINEPYTTCNALDALGSVLAALVDRPWPESSARDPAGVERAHFPVPGFRALVELAVLEIAHYGRADAIVMTRIADTLARVAAITERHDRRADLLAVADVIAAIAAEHVLLEAGRAQVAAAHDQIRALAR